MESDIHIRSATIEDLLPYRELRLEALKNNPTAFGADYEESLNKPLSYWEGRVSANPDEQSMFVAEQNGQLIGMAGIFKNTSKKNNHTATIISVYVKPKWRGRHISEKLINTCIDWAFMHGVIVVKLAVTANNTSAIRSYERCGFKIYGTEPKAIRYEGVFYDEHLMAKEISFPEK